MTRGMLSTFFHFSAGHHHHHHGHRRPTSSPPSSPTPQHTFSATMMQEKISDAEGIITKWDPQGSSYAKNASLFDESREEARLFLRAVSDLHRAMHYFVADSHASSSALLVSAQTLMQAAMRRLQKEFYEIVSANRGHLDTESVTASARSSQSLDSASSLSDLEEAEIRSATESIDEVELTSALATADLRSIAECMISTGYGKECVKIYKLVRRSIVDESLYKLGFEKLTPTQLHKLDWDALDIRIRNWLGASKVAVRNIFSAERVLCDQVFDFSPSIHESCFAEVSVESAVEFFRFPELVASKTKLSPEKMFRVLDMYDSISELWPEIESVFSYQSTSAARSQAISSLLKLGEAARSMFADFELAIEKENSKAAVPGGGLHPLTRYVMNYMSLLANYSSALEDIFADYPLQTPTLSEPLFDAPPMSASAQSSPSSREEEDALSPISVRMAWFIVVLMCKLDGKAELYREAALGYLFLANNLQYVVNKACGGKLSELLGDEWVARHEAKARRYVASYERLAWGNVLAAIPHDREKIAETDARAAKERMRRFNEAFDEAYQGQSGWVVVDGRMRDELKLSIERKVVPAYRPFYDRCQSLLQGEGDPPAVLRFAPGDLANDLFDLFHGGAGSGSGSGSSVSGSSVSGSSTESPRSI